MPTEAQQLRLELLRLRGAMQRAELLQAAGELRATARRWVELASLGKEVGSILAGGSSWSGAALALARQRPWLATLAVAVASRVLRGRRLGWAALAALAWAAWRARKTNGPRADVT